MMLINITEIVKTTTYFTQVAMKNASGDYSFSSI